MSNDERRTVADILARLAQEEPQNSLIAALAARPLAQPADDGEVPTEEFFRVPPYARAQVQR